MHEYNKNERDYNENRHGYNGYEQLCMITTKNERDYNDNGHDYNQNEHDCNDNECDFGLVHSLQKHISEECGILDRACGIQAHWQLRDNQQAHYDSMSEPELVPAATRVLACDYAELL